jgi:lipopolysaccharide export system permease protein
LTLATRYLLKRLLPPLLVSFCIFSGILVLMEFFNLTDLIINKGVPFRAVGLILLTKIPETFSITVPMSLIMAVIMTFGRLAEDNELTVFRMAGYPLHSMLLPPLTVGFILALGLVGLQQYGLPQLSDYKERRLSELEIINPVRILQPQTFMEIPPYTLYAETIDGPSMENVWIEDRQPDNPQIITSQTGRWIKKGPGQYELKLDNGTLHQKTGDGYRVLKFSEQTLQFSPELDAGNLGGNDDFRSLGEKYTAYRSLGQEIHDHEDPSEVPSKKKKKHRKLRTEFHRTLALPFATFFLVLVTTPTGLLTKQYGTVANLIFCIGIFFSYYILLTLTEPLATQGYLDSALAMWAPNLLLGATGIGLFYYVRRYGS